MVHSENEKLIQEYLDIAVNISEDLDRTLGLLSDDCIWYITPPGITFSGKQQLSSFINMAMGSRTHNADSKISVSNWFATGDNFCVEYFHASIVSRLRIRATENVCLVCHIQNGKFDRINEYVDASKSTLIRLGLNLLPLIIKVRSFFR